MNSTVIPTLDTAIAEVEDAMAVLFARGSARWKEYAALVHPELQPAGYKILAALVHIGPCQAGVLAETLSTDKSVMSRQVRCMQEYGLIESRVDEHDARARVIAATAEAAARVEHARAQNTRLFRDELRSWPADDLVRFASMVERICE